MYDRLGIAIKIEEQARLLEEAMDEQRKIIGELLQSIQDYVDVVSKL